MFRGLVKHMSEQWEEDVLAKSCSLHLYVWDRVVAKLNVRIWYQSRKGTWPGFGFALHYGNAVSLTFSVWGGQVEYEPHDHTPWPEEEDVAF